MSKTERYGKAARPLRNIRNAETRAKIKASPRCQQCRTYLCEVSKLAAYFGGGTFVHQYRPGARYCTPACRQKAYRARKAGP